MLKATGTRKAKERWCERAESARQHCGVGAPVTPVLAVNFHRSGA